MKRGSGNIPFFCQSAPLVCFSMPTQQAGLFSETADQSLGEKAQRWHTTMDAEQFVSAVGPPMLAARSEFLFPPILFQGFHSASHAWKVSTSQR